MLSKDDFINFLLESSCLNFGEFVTKSGRLSPYFLNFGEISDGKSYSILGDFYSEFILRSLPYKVDHLYGPSYKGIPLAITCAEKLAEKTGEEVRVTYNRKELKDHGEKGSFIGADLNEHCSVIIIEDVITKGTSIDETMALLQPLGVKVEGVLVGVDRMEKFDDQMSANEYIGAKYNIPVYSIVNINDVIRFLDQTKKISDDIYSHIKSYQSKYCKIDPSSGSEVISFS